MSLIRLDKFLADCGVGTRNDVKKYIKNGRVAVDGCKAEKADIKIDTEKNIIKLDGKVLEYEKFIYIMLNKPKGVISATFDNNEKTVIDLLDIKYKNKKLFPVGRLDKDTVGLLIITNDGRFAHNSLSPKKHITKKYYAEIKGIISDEDVTNFKNGVIIDSGYKCKPAALKLLQTENGISKTEIKISEGKFHQIKKMAEAVGKEVIFLKRIKFGEIELDNTLKEGEYRILNDDERAYVNKILGGLKND